VQAGDRLDLGTACNGCGALLSAVAASDIVPMSSTGREFSDEAARDALAALSGPYLPWSAGVMRPAGLVIVCNDIVLNERRRVVELGSGVSTVLLARLLCQRSPLGGFRIAAVEHDARWARWVIEQLDREGTGSDVVVVHAPLAPHPRAVAGLSWYDEAALDRGLRIAMRGDPIDLLLVDGPPAYAAGHGLVRYPALPVLCDWLAPGATVVLDDAERPGEQEVLRQWERETGLDFDRWADRAGVAVARTGDADPVGGPRHG
jgi:predicted O-methyltransferase YrrM